MSVSGIPLNPQQATFSADNAPRNTKVQERIRSVNLDAVFDRISLDMDINEISPIEALALLFKSIQNLQRLYSLIKQGNLGEAFDVKRAVFGDDVSMGRELNPKRRRSSQSAEMLRNLSSELELPIRKSSRIESNFEDLEEETFADDSSVLTTSSFNSRIPSYCRSDVDFDLSCKLIKRFYLKTPPSLSLEAYMERINHYSKPGTAVYLSSSLYLFNVAFGLKTTFVGLEENTNTNGKGLAEVRKVLPAAPYGTIQMIPFEDLNAFRLVLTVIRTASKLVEDKNYKQSYYCKICGLQDQDELFRLEMGFLFLINFNLMVNENILLRHLVRMKSFNENMKRYT
ncbi:unnamed protein product [Kuraishia capsulata CBS 1993]|uniref:Uncharacterized protein n=1 Tax=Kuraishia capsulata CBS 1993 TaxID=1382522 RepID=W6MGD2_9ASCO|nr:uncharacterized protein KUCA_T00000503001 [Kuraishia capsulata CBS 1993]CDK24538.1 unnamed protein product [Kuraishia capsulata CBS 1993]